MWQIKGFEPFAQCNHKYGYITADGQGRILAVTWKERFSGIATRCYYPDAEDYSTHPELGNPESLKVMDWIKDRDGVVARLLDVKVGEVKGIFNAFIYTIFGCNVYSRGNFQLAFDRPYYSSLKTTENTKRTRFTIGDASIVLAYVKNKCDVYAAFEEVTGLKVDNLNRKAIAKNRINKALRSEQGRMLLMATMREYLQQQGITPEVFAQRLLDSVPDKIMNKTQLEMWELIGLLSPDVRKELLEAKGEEVPENGDGKYLLPGTKDAKEASYEDVCQICNGTRKYKAQVRFSEESEETREVELDCPVCMAKNANKQLSEVSQASVAMRL